MTLKTRIHDELDRLGQLASASGARATLGLDIDDGRLTAELTAIDQLAVAFEQFTFTTPRLAASTIDELSRLAEALSQQIGYLLESIRPVEIDQESCIVQMRSNPPQKDDDGTCYYELLVRRGEISLCRFSKVSGQPRRVIAANITREVFCRLAHDFSASV